MSWIRIGGTYEVEVLQRFDPESEEAQRAWQVDRPNNRTGTRESCGERLGDHLEGMTLPFRALKELTGRNDPCNSVAADVPLPGRVFEEGDPSSRLPFIRDAFVTLDDGLSGRYIIGVLPVNRAFLEAFSGDSFTDYMLYREFMRDTGCDDSYFVRIRDERGHLITRDLGTGDDAGDGEP